jgi:1,5-anhydro-D-fructose reductase (1,5-anhydro-D-mannitol-forming)
MSSTLGWGVIGLGNIVYTTMAPAMVAEPECDLVAGVSRDQGRAEKFAAKFGARYAYSDYAEMLANPEVEAVFIATPNAFHADEVVAAAEAGKHVMCDKPLATTVEDAHRAYDACRAAGVKLGINFHNRHMPWVRDVRDLIQKGALGDVQTIHVEASAGLRQHEGWRNDPKLAGVGAVYNIGVHVFDFLGFLLDSQPVEVTAMFDHEEPGRLETEALILIRFANGTRVFVDTNQNNPHPHNDIAIYGSAGRVTGVELTRSRVGGELAVLTDEGEEVTPYPAVQAHRLCLAAFTRAILSGEEPNASGLDGVRSVALCEAITTSVRERRRVEVTA